MLEPSLDSVCMMLLAFETFDSSCECTGALSIDNVDFNRKNGLHVLARNMLSNVCFVSTVRASRICHLARCGIIIFQYVLCSPDKASEVDVNICFLLLWPFKFSNWFFFFFSI